jgi:hypothetical protein
MYSIKIRDDAITLSLICLWSHEHFFSNLAAVTNTGKFRRMLSTYGFYQRVVLRVTPAATRDFHFEGHI